MAVSVLIAATAFSVMSFAKDKKKARSASARSVASAGSKTARRNNSPRRARGERAEKKGRRGESAGREREEREREGMGGDPDGSRYEALIEQEEYWAARVTYPTGKFDPTWVTEALRQDAEVERGLPSGAGRPVGGRFAMNPLSLSPTGFTALGPAPERMTGCTGCFDYGTTAGRVNSIAIDPTTTTPGSIVAYIATVGGGVWFALTPGLSKKKEEAPPVDVGGGFGVMVGYGGNF